MFGAGYPGKMMANTPWSGYYEVQPAIWAMAHTTQFAQPGWRYLDTGCGYLNPDGQTGSYVTLKDPQSDHYSVILETSGLDGIAEVALSINGDINQGDVYVWKSDENEQFIMTEILKPVKGKVSFNIEGESIYSLTTSTGQKKGIAQNKIPDNSPFPMPFFEDFEGYVPGKTPRFFSDYVGGFETSAGTRAVSF